MRRPIAGAIDDAQHLAGVGQRQHQGVIAPDAVVGDVHPFFALAGGLDHGAVHVDRGAVEEVVGLLRPDLQARVVEDVDEGVEVSQA